MKTIIPLAFALASSLASASGWDFKNDQNLVQTLTDRGYVEVSKGLYQNDAGGGNRYVAFGAQARLALAAHVLQFQADYEKVLKANGISKSERGTLNNLLNIAEELSRPTEISKTMISEGSCASGAQVAAGAAAESGESAMAAAGVTIDFGPTTPTANSAYAGTDNTFAFDEGVGSDWAYASTYEFRSCGSYAAGSVSCDGGGAFAMESSLAPDCIPR
jgi:hypothetical protein